MGIDTLLKPLLTLWPLITIIALCGCIWMAWRWHRLHRTRTAGSLRGHCRDCGYQPATGTQTCPECGGAVLDLRLFRPLGAADTPAEARGTSIDASR